MKPADFTLQPSHMMICPVVALRHLPDSERDVLRRFLSEHVRGMDERSDKRWRRLWGQIFKAEPGEGFVLSREEERSGPFHRRHRVVLERLFESQERFRHIDKLHDWLKVGGGFVTWEPGKDSKPVAIPRSTSFPQCSEDDMRESHAAMVDFLHTERAQRYLWKSVKPALRPAMLESVLLDPEHQ